MIIDLDRIRARHNAWYNGEISDFAGLPEEVDAAFRARFDALHQSLDEKTMAFEIVREDVPALIAEVERLRDVRIPELIAEIERLVRSRKLVMNYRRVIRRERDDLLEDLARVKEENALLKRRIDGLRRKWEEGAQ